MSKAEESGLFEDGIKFYKKMGTVRCAFSRNIRDLIFLDINTFIEIFFYLS